MSWPPRRPIPPSLSTIVTRPRRGERKGNAAGQPCYMQCRSPEPWGVRSSRPALLLVHELMQRVRAGIHHLVDRAGVKAAQSSSHSPSD